MGGFFISNFCDNQLWLCTLLISCCLSSAKIQNFKAIHNSEDFIREMKDVVYHLQRYKISKQFTTKIYLSSHVAKLFIICKDTKFQSNLQRSHSYILKFHVVYHSQRSKKGIITLSFVACVECQRAIFAKIECSIF